MQQKNDYEKLAWLRFPLGRMTASQFVRKKRKPSEAMMNRAREGAKSVREARASESMADFMRRYE